MGFVVMSRLLYHWTDWRRDKRDNQSRCTQAHCTIKSETINECQERCKNENMDQGMLFMDILFHEGVNLPARPCYTFDLYKFRKVKFKDSFKGRNGKQLTRRDSSVISIYRKQMGKSLFVLSRILFQQSSLQICS